MSVETQPQQFPPLDSQTKPFLTSAEFSYYFNIKPQTARVHRMRGCELVKSTTLYGRVAYPTEACKAKAAEILLGAE